MQRDDLKYFSEHYLAFTATKIKKKRLYSYKRICTAARCIWKKFPSADTPRRRMRSREKSETSWEKIPAKFQRNFARKAFSLLASRAQACARARVRALKHAPADLYVYLLIARLVLQADASHVL